MKNDKQLLVAELTATVALERKQNRQGMVALGLKLISQQGSC
jgi:hypothetical protein